ncbi:hypothetical protein KSU1_C0283 [Candidatus Jettenia caeni]|uniref:Uncharacterized protein n=1 Tax=Candidatus Jettenia caeni TaxID=247490 RepID=I3IJI4_9BACT|nr:hypothetical protein KSU1_C0283 [Candidatus Jettenia caeni]
MGSITKGEAGDCSSPFLLPKQKKYPHFPLFSTLIHFSPFSKGELRGITSLFLCFGLRLVLNDRKR